jgi:hypothetical protein
MTGHAPLLADETAAVTMTEIIGGDLIPATGLAAAVKALLTLTPVVVALTVEIERRRLPTAARLDPISQRPRRPPPSPKLTKRPSDLRSWRHGRRRRKVRARSRKR